MDYNMRERERERADQPKYMYIQKMEWKVSQSDLIYGRNKDRKCVAQNEKYQSKRGQKDTGKMMEAAERISDD